ncbi:MAG: ABC transporter substrate-binding protein [Christensenellaceae bacterium]|jgi:iron complex transport system substrate-binding protein|nr:ABC transporter substrate-binding protein [Christensenellaceae bacterium]
MNKKYIFITIAVIAFLVVGILGLTSCDKDEDNTGDPVVDARPTVTIVDANGDEFTIKTNPTSVAIYDYGVLDILDSVGFDTLGIEKLAVPNKDGLPADLASYKERDNVISAGSLFIVDLDVLDLIQPELIILGGRSFGRKADNSAVTAAEKEELVNEAYEKFPNATFIKLSVNSSNSSLLSDMQRNAYALARIFNNVEIAIKYKAIDDGMDEIQAKAKASGKTALFGMMVDQTTFSVFNVNSRFDMLYEEFGFTPVDPQAVAWGDAHGLNARCEYVLDKNPDLIFILDRSATIGTGAGYENFLADASIQQTEAYKNDNIYLLTGEAWYTMTGGFTAAERMIEDINQYFDSLEE